MSTRPRRLLIVSPHFPPVNAPDMQRVRMLLPHLAENGWEATVLAVQPELIEGAVLEPRLLDSLPPGLQVRHSGGIPARLTRRLGFGNLWLRCGRALTREGDRLVREGDFDLAFFSTTQFASFPLGPRWLRRQGLPYVLDYQDPWRSDHYARTGLRPPGGQLKYWLSQLQARFAEPRALHGAAGVIGVSDSYGPLLARLNPGFDAARLQVMPFGASERDLELARTHTPANPPARFDDGLHHLVYTGYCGPVMEFTLRALLLGFRAFLASHPVEAGRVRLHFIGTDYAPGPLAREHVLPLARSLGVEAYVSEHCRRVPYFDSLHCLCRADSLVALGSDDPGYSASKIYPYILARRPLLLLYHEQSLATRVATATGAGLSLSFRSRTDLEPLAAAIHRQWFENGAYLVARPFNQAAFAPYEARETTRRLCAYFDSLLAGRERPGQSGNHQAP